MLQNVIGYRSSSKTSASLVPSILGNEFLDYFLNKNPSIRLKLENDCKFAKPGFFTVTGFLDKIGVFPYELPNDQQKRNLITECLKRDLDLKEYEHRAIRTNAYLVSVKNSDQFFAASLLNRLIETFFEKQRIDKQNEFKKTSEYVSETIALAVVETNNAKKALDKFFLDEVKSIIPSVISIEEDLSKELQKVKISKIKKFGEAEKFGETLRGTYVQLVSLDGTDYEALAALIEDNGKGGVLSNAFLTAVRDLLRNENNETDKVDSLETLIETEIKRVKLLLDANKINVTQAASETESILSIMEKLDTLETELVKKKIYQENLKNYLSTVSFENGTNLLQKNIRHSRALPPIVPDYPRKKEIIILFASVAFLLSCFAVCFRQYFGQRVFTLSQFDDLCPTAHKTSFSLSGGLVSEEGFYKWKRNSVPFELGFLKTFLEAGKVGCIIDISKKISSKQVAEKTIQHLLILSVQSNLEVATMQCSGGKLVEYGNDLDSKKRSESINVIGVSPEIKKKQNRGLDFFIKDEIKNNDKVLIGVESDQNELVKYQAIENSDFYILVGMAGQFDVNEIRKYIGTLSDKKTKCIGIFLAK